jgi:hypothetical protein
MPTAAIRHFPVPFANPVNIRYPQRLGVFEL